MALPWGENKTLRKGSQRSTFGLLSLDSQSACLLTLSRAFPCFLLSSQLLISQSSSQHQLTPLPFKRLPRPQATLLHFMPFAATHLTTASRDREAQSPQRGNLPGTHQGWRPRSFLPLPPCPTCAQMARQSKLTALSRLCLNAGECFGGAGSYMCGLKYFVLDYTNTVHNRDWCGGGGGRRCGGEERKRRRFLTLANRERK